MFTKFRFHLCERRGNKTRSQPTRSRGQMWFSAPMPPNSSHALPHPPTSPFRAPPTPHPSLLK
ncbi:hypothetical protein E2C01_066671 [Portunus trituberculatus]|uniref:Uncharacterized protein n=1 Tax=Portunus trituberculatus TaxID=210409 RepID=A0A5B7HSY9_PORTR|nr:hypothetical protein [Portunus trituberculatus]